MTPCLSAMVGRLGAAHFFFSLHERKLVSFGWRG